MVGKGTFYDDGNKSGEITEPSGSLIHLFITSVKYIITDKSTAR